MARLPTIIHVHIKKSGGQTINKMLTDIFGRLSRLYALAQVPYKLKDVSDLIRVYGIEAYASHSFRLGQLPHDKHDIVVIGFVRDPVSQITSAYFYARESKVHKTHPAKTMSITAYMQAMLAGKIDRSVTAESQLWQLTGAEGAEGLKIAEEELPRTYIFPLEQFDSSRLLWTRRCQNKIRFKNPGKINVSKKDQLMTAQTHALIAKLPWVYYDRQLHKLAHENMERAIVELFGTRASFEEARRAFR